MNFGTGFLGRAVVCAAVFVALGAQDSSSPAVSLHQPTVSAATSGQPRAQSVRAKAQNAASATPASATPAQAASPISETHTSGSWTIRCYHAPGSVCDISQVAFERRRNLRVLGISIAFVPAKNVFTGQFVVPLGVSFAKGMTIQVGAYALSNLKYRRCEHDGCYVEGVLPQALIDAMSQPDITKGAVAIEAVNGNKLSLPMGLDGFRDGLALLKQLDAAKGGPAPASP